MPLAFKPGAKDAGAAPASFEPTYSPGDQIPAKRTPLITSATWPRGTRPTSTSRHLALAARCNPGRFLLAPVFLCWLSWTPSTALHNAGPLTVPLCSSVKPKAAGSAWYFICPRTPAPSSHENVLESRGCPTKPCGSSRKYFAGGHKDPQRRRFMSVLPIIPLCATTSNRGPTWS